MRKFVLAGVVIAAIAGVSIHYYGSRAQEQLGPDIDLSRYELVFSDEFDKLDISAAGPGTKWIAHTPWNGDFGQAAFTNPGPAGPFTIRDGKLLIEARKRPDGKWQSGLIASVDKNGVGFKQRYGYWEARAKLPPGKGLWSAFWLNAAQPPGSDKPGVEVDVIEHYGHFPQAYESVFHIWPKPAKDDPNYRRKVMEVPTGSLYSDFHTYGVDVSPEWITIYRDRKPQWRWKTPPEHQVDLMVLANLAMGPDWPIDETPNPSVMEIDYIRAYKARP